MFQFVKWAMTKILAEVLVFITIVGSAFLITRGIILEQKPDIAIGIVAFITGISFYFSVKKVGKRNG